MWSCLPHLLLRTHIVCIEKDVSDMLRPIFHSAIRRLLEVVSLAVTSIDAWWFVSRQLMLRMTRDPSQKSPEPHHSFSALLHIYLRLCLTLNPLLWPKTSPFPSDCVSPGCQGLFPARHPLLSHLLPLLRPHQVLPQWCWRTDRAGQDAVCWSAIR